MIYQLPRPIQAGYAYDSLRIENIQYDGTAYTADVFGIAEGQPMPLIFKTASGLHRITSCTITDTEIDAVLNDNPDVTDRLQAGLKRAMERLYDLLEAK